MLKIEIEKESTPDRLKSFHRGLPPNTGIDQKDAIKLVAANFPRAQVHAYPDQKPGDFSAVMNPKRPDIYKDSIFLTSMALYTSRAGGKRIIFDMPYLTVITQDQDGNCDIEFHTQLNEKDVKEMISETSSENAMNWEFIGRKAQKHRDAA